MRSSKSQVIDLLNGWKKDRRVSIYLTSGEHEEIKFGGFIVEVTPVSLTIAGSGFSLNLNLSLATNFDWHDSTEAPLSARNFYLQQRYLGSMQAGFWECLGGLR